MTSSSAPIVSLQTPTDVSLGEIEAELGKIWRSYNSINTTDGSIPAATRAATFSLIIYEPEETQQLLAALGFYTGPVDGITGPSTRSALRAAQEAYGLVSDGRATNETVDRLRQEYQKKIANDSDSTLPKAGPTVIGGGSGVADAIADQNPCRIITVCPTRGEDCGVSAQVSAYCPVKKQSRATLICCEYITLTGTSEALERASDLISALMIPELPCFLWWKASPDPNHELFKKLCHHASCLVLDTSTSTYPETELANLKDLQKQGINVADLNWQRLAAWQELTAEAFDPPERRAALGEVDRVTIDYEQGNPAQALMFLGWLASRLQWRPIAYLHEGGDYDIRKISLMSSDQRLIEAELAGIPTANLGEVAGDLVGLRLMSTNQEAECCTILCSETTGCMRMEAGGSAQACRIRQVAALTDQQAETLLGKQLQSWERNVLYEESMDLTLQILHSQKA